MLLASPGNREVTECVFICINCDQWWHFSSPLKHSCERIYRRNNSYRQPEILWFPCKCQVVFPSGGGNFTCVYYYDLRPSDIVYESICHAGMKAENWGVRVLLAYRHQIFLFVVVYVKVKKKKGWYEPLKHFMDIIDHICFPLLFYCRGSLW